MWFIKEEGEIREERKLTPPFSIGFDGLIELWNSPWLATEAGLADILIDLML